MSKPLYPKPTKYTPEQRIERRAEQAVRAIIAGKTTASNEERIARRVERLAPDLRAPWLTLKLGADHLSTANVLHRCLRADEERAALAEASCEVPEVAP